MKVRQFHRLSHCNEDRMWTDLNAVRNLFTRQGFHRLHESHRLTNLVDPVLRLGEFDCNGLCGHRGNQFDAWDPEP